MGTVGHERWGVRFGNMPSWSEADLTVASNTAGFPAVAAAFAVENLASRGQRIAKSDLTNPVTVLIQEQRRVFTPRMQA